MRRGLRWGVASVFDALFVPHCVACDAFSEDVFCRACSLDVLPGPSLTGAGVRGRGVFLYEGAVQRAILRMKARGLAWIAVRLGQALFAALGPEASERLIIPVPSRVTVRRHGFSPAAKLVPSDRSLEPCLRFRPGPTRPQKGLSRRARQTNVLGDLILRERVSIVEPVLVVDDVLTTGATVREARRVLHAAGVTDVEVAVLAVKA